MVKKKRKEITTFNVRLLCRKCEHDWIEEIDKEIYVRYEKDNNYMIPMNGTKKDKKYFTCPKCGSKEKIARLSLEERK